MPLYKVYKARYSWGIWKLDESIEELALLLPPSQKVSLFDEAWARFLSEKRRREWLAVRVLLYALTDEIHPIAYLPSGKPYLNEYPYHISISHTEGYVAVAFFPEGDIGIDIERRTPKVLRVKERFMDAEECANSDILEAVLLHWSGKETLFKLLGTENVDFREHLHLSPFTVAHEGTISARECRTDERRRFLLHYLIDTDFVLTWSLG